MTDSYTIFKACAAELDAGKYNDSIIKAINFAIDNAKPSNDTLSVADLYNMPYGDEHDTIFNVFFKGCDCDCYNPFCTPKIIPPISADIEGIMDGLRDFICSTYGDAAVVGMDEGLRYIISTYADRDCFTGLKVYQITKMVEEMARETY